MRFALSILLAGLCVSCSTVEPQSGSAVSLPKITAEGVSYEDGIQKEEAVILSSVYFRRFVSGCGMPDTPQDAGQYWRVQLWGGYGGSDYGTLRLAKDGSEVLLAPPRRGFKSVTREMLRHHNLI
jgi:hypothetical protein